MAKITKVGTGAGAPGFSILTRPFRRFTRPTFGRRSVRTLQKRDEARGITFPDTAQNIETRHGYASAGSGGNRGAAEIHQKPAIGPLTDSRTKVKAPRPAPGGIKKRV